MYITRKIELRVPKDNLEKYNETWKYIRKLNDTIYRGANFIVNNQYFNEAFNERILRTDDELKDKREDLQKHINKVTEKLSKAKDDEKDKLKKERDKLYKQLNAFTKVARDKASDIYGTSGKNTTYQLLRKEFPELSSYVSASLNDVITKNFSNEIFDVRTGKRSLRSYRKGMPIPFMKGCMRFEINGGEILMHWFNDINFVLNFGRDRSNNKLIMQRVLDGSYEIGDSSIQLKDRKLFLLLVVDIPQEEKELDQKLSVGVDLGVAVPAYCALSEGQARLAIGSKEEFLKIRTHMQSRRRRIQKALTLTSGGKGRTKKLKAMEMLKEKERNFVHTYNHMVSSRIVKFALDNCAGKIKLEFLEGFGEYEKNSFILRNWSYYELQQMIKYKAEKEGIDILFVDPYHTSQTCAVCGHYEEGQREVQEWFICKNVDCNPEGKRVSADYNASLNISRSEKYVSNKEDCEYFKHHKEDNN